MGNVGSITGRRDERTHVARDTGSNGNRWELRPVTELVSSEDEAEASNSKSYDTKRAPKPFPFYRLVG